MLPQENFEIKMLSGALLHFFLGFFFLLFLAANSLLRKCGKPPQMAPVYSEFMLKIIYFIYMPIVYCYMV